MLGFSALGEFALGEIDEDEEIVYVYYLPVSKIMAGGFANTRPASVVILGVDLIWDDGSTITNNFNYIVWDNGDNIAWEA